MTPGAPLLNTVDSTLKFREHACRSRLLEKVGLERVHWVTAVRRISECGGQPDERVSEIGRIQQPEFGAKSFSVVRVVSPPGRRSLVGGVEAAAFWSISSE